MKLARLLAMAGALMLAAPLYAQDTAGGDRGDAHLDAAARQAVNGVNDFSLDLFRRADATSPNLFISPVSASAAIGLAYRGARGTTATELRATLHFSRSPETYLAADAAILRSLNLVDDGHELHVADALWLQESLPLRSDFEADVATQAGAAIQRTDFRGSPDAARLAINSWVAANTNDRIKDLLDEGDVDNKTRLVLVDTIYWRGRWETPFDTSATKRERFTGLHGESTTTPLMHERGDFHAVERDGVKAIQLSYEGGEVSMVVLLPSGPSGLPRLEAELTYDGMKRWLVDLDRAQPRKAIVALPKMHLGWRGDLVPALRELGARTAFSDHADFSGMADEPFPGEVPGATGLKIRSVIQQTYLDVDEQGSEATAATAVGDVVVSGQLRRLSEPPLFLFRADKPFLFLLRDRRTGLILFIGRYVAP